MILYRFTNKKTPKSDYGIRPKVTKVIKTSKESEIKIICM